MYTYDAVIHRRACLSGWWEDSNVLRRRLDLYVCARLYVNVYVCVCVRVRVRRVGEKNAMFFVVVLTCTYPLE